jgi:hypothetical protein
VTYNYDDEELEILDEEQERENRLKLWDEKKSEQSEPSNSDKQTLKPKSLA